MRNKFQDKCFRCSKNVPANSGFFQAVAGMNKKQRQTFKGKRWLVRCSSCVGKGNKVISNT